MHHRPDVRMRHSGTAQLSGHGATPFVSTFRTYLEIGLSHDGMSFRAGQGGCFFRVAKIAKA
jgi:hypothetical protein